MKKRRFIALSFVLFFLINCVNNSFASSSSSIEIPFENAFRGTVPFYGVTVARDTMTAVYGPLTPEEEGLVFSLLNALFSGDSRELLNLSARFIQEKSAWFIHIKNTLQQEEAALDVRPLADLVVDEAASSFVSSTPFRDFLGLKDEKIRCKETLKAFIVGSISHRGSELIDAFRTRLREHFRVPGTKPSITVFENKSKEIFDFILTFNERMEKRKHDTLKTNVLKDFTDRDLFERYSSQIREGDPREFFRSILGKIEKIARLSQKIYGEKIRNNPCIVIFNEMFFSKDRPLSTDDFTAKIRILQRLTQRHPNLLAHANFLFESLQPFESAEEYTAYMEEQRRRVTLLSTRTGKQIFESDRFEGYEGYAAQFSSFSPSLSVLKNQSSIFWNGHPIIHYLKSSYRTEAEAHLNGKFYELGTGEDEISSALETSSGEMAVAQILKKNLSTEICYDLEIGVRKKLASYPAEGKIHVVISNCLSLAQLDRAKNLPDHIPLILHVDPQDQEILLRTESKAILLPETLSVVSGDPLHTSKISQLTKAMPLATFRINLTDNNIFIFHIWDLKYCLQTEYLNRSVED